MARPPFRKAILPLFAVPLIAIAFAVVAYADNYLNRGVEWSAELSPIPYTEGTPLGANVFLDKEADEANIRRTLAMLRDGGFKYIRQDFLWRDIEPARGYHWDDKHNQSAWAKYDRIVKLANEYGVQIIARLDRPPDWARPTGLKLANPGNTGPPDNYDDYGKFVYDVVKRYKGKVKFFQVWNEPNLHGEWNDQPINPAEYVRLLKVAYTWAKVANPNCVILTAGLAPTDQLGPENLSDLVFAEEMYKNGAKDYFDIMSVMVYGLGYSPDDRRIDFDRANFSRPALTREIMVRYGDEQKPVWASEYAWISLPDNWTGNPSVWGDPVTEQQQADYLVRGYERAQQEWPWMGVMTVWAFRWVEPPAETGADPTPFFAIVNHDFTPRPAYNALKEHAKRLSAAYTGYYTAGSTAIEYQGGWTKQKANGRVFRVASSPGATATIRFHGTRLDLDLGAVGTESRLSVTIDGAPSSLLPKDNRGISHLDLQPVSTGWDGARYAVAEELSDGDHTATIVLESGEGVSLRGIVVSREQPIPWSLPAAYALLSLGLVISLARLQPWLVWLIDTAPRTLAGLGRTLESSAGAIGGAVVLDEEAMRRWEPLMLAVMGVVLAIYYFSPEPAIAIAAAIVFGVLALVRTDLSVALVAFALPFLYHPKQIMGAEFTLAEFLILVSLAAYAIRLAYLAAISGSIRSPFVNLSPAIQLRRFISHPFAPAVALFLLVATVSLLIPDREHVKYSLREYRLVIVEPIIFYILLASTANSERQLLRVLDFLIAGGLAVSLLAIGQAALGTQLVEAGGVSRVLGVFRHPNNLALYLDRIILVLAGLAIFLPASRRRWAYALLMVPPVIALGLTFSRGAIFAVAGGVVLLALMSRKRRIILPVVAGVGLVAIAGVLWVRVDRFTSTIELGTWTRLYVWRSAINMIRDHPIMGVGLDQFLYQYNPKYVLPEAWSERFTSHPHNILLDYWTRLGIMGLIAGAWLIIRFFGTAYKLMLRLASGPARAVIAATIGSMLALVLHGLVDNSYFLMDLALMFWLGVGSVQVLWHHQQSVQKRRAMQYRRETAVESLG